MNPTDEQSAILSAAASSNSNILMNALAGCGKTSTLEMVERAIPTKPILYLVFNKKNAEEAEERLLSTTTVRTFNSLGHRIWAKAVVKKNLALNPRKTQDLLKALIDEAPKAARQEMWDCYWEVIHGVAMAKSLGYVPEGKYPSVRRLISQSDYHRSLDESPDDLTSDLIDAILSRSIAAAYEGHIDYNDQIYMPALFGGTFPRFPLVLVDEAQDLNPVNHAMLEKLVHQRLMVVGDPWQSIYAFRGAMQGSMAALEAKYKMTPLNLSTSFRCPSEIVKHAQWRVPHFKWIKEGGEVIQATDLHYNTIPDSAAIICRNNAPLFRCAMQLIQNGRSVQIAGSDIGPKIIGIMRKLGPDNSSQEWVYSAIEDWRVEKKAKESKSADDIADCMRVFAGFGATLGQAIGYAENLFSQKGAIRLLTGHKAKGLEYDNVYHLDPGLCRDDEQDLNLRYVITTRSKDRLTEIDSFNIKWN